MLRAELSHAAGGRPAYLPAYLATLLLFPYRLKPALREGVCCGAICCAGSLGVERTAASDLGFWYSSDPQSTLRGACITIERWLWEGEGWLVAVCIDLHPFFACHPWLTG